MEKKDRIYRLRKGTAPLSYLLQNRHKKSKPLTYYDEKFKTPSGNIGANRALRYATNQLSVFTDEQDDNFTLGEIEFLDGYLTVKASNVLLQQFLHYHPSNGIKFEEYDPEEAVRSEVARTELFVEAASILKNMDLGKMATIIKVGLDLDPSGMKPFQIKKNAFYLAQTEPEKLLELAKDDVADDFAEIFEMFDAKVIAYRNSKKDIYYNLPDKKSKITSLPFGVDSKDATIKFFLSEEGQKVMEEVQEFLVKK